MNTETDGVVELEIASPVVEKKTRGRKKKIPDNIVNNTESVIETVKPIPKKRGRKPKGGKIVQETSIDDTSQISEPNIILHLRCSLEDINENETYTMKYNPNIESVQSFNFDNSKIDNLLLEQLDEIQTIENVTIEDDNDENVSSRNDITCLNNKDDRYLESITDKLNSLKTKLHRNTISDKRSACFWCTYDFDSPPIFIPKHEFKNTYQVYGCFCSPECSVAHLMNEKIDSSIKFERYQLLNHIYGKIYNNEKNIKPAPDPHYLLEKFYGTLTIKEYRDLFKNDQLLLVVEKPLTHVFPELYEDNTDFILNQRTIPSNSTFKLRNRTVNKQTSVIESLNSKNK
jgi:hypothetical protein